MAVIAALILIAGCFLPWFSQGSYHITGWEENAFFRPGWTIFGCMVVMVLSFLAGIPWPRWPILLVVGAVLAAAAWRAFKLDAFGWGLAVCFVGWILAIAATLKASSD